MADPKEFSEATELPTGDPDPINPTISVTRRFEPLRPDPTSDPTAQATWHPTPTDATPPMSDPDGALTRVQDTNNVIVRTPGMPEIPGYEIIAEIGRGGMGVVFKARQLDLNRPVAIKMILGEGYERPEQLARFKLEAEMAARIHHQNVVQVYDSGTCAGRPYLVLEWVDGGTLSTYLKSKPQSARAAARTVSLLARAVHATHCVGIVHRDLKPGNVLVAPTAAATSSRATGSTASTVSRPNALAVTLTLDGQAVALTPKVTDFGLVKRMDEDTRLTETGRVLGTPEYMAPEQAQGRPADIGPPTDVYALGIILYQMLTGQTPFHDTSIHTIMRRVVDDEPVPPRRHQSKLPKDLETICLKCLEKAPGRRYQTAEALGDDLDAFLDGRPIGARATSTVERAYKWAARRPAVAALSAASVLFFVLGFAGITWQWRAAVAQRDRAVKAETATDAVNHFLVDDLLATATPEKQLGRKVTVEEVLQNAAARIDGRFADQPEVAADLRLALGNSYRKLGLFERADRHLTAGLDLRRKTLGDAHRDTLAAASDRGLLLADERKWDEAIPLLRQVVADARAKLGADDSLTLESNERLAVVLQQRGDAAEAESVFKETLDAARRVFGPADPRTLTVLNDFGILLEARKKLPDAEAAFREAADGRAKALAPTHPATLESLANLAVVLDDEGQWAKAKPIYQQVLAGKLRVLGRDHIDTLSTMNNLADLLERHGEPDAALPLFDDAYEGYRKVLGRDNPETLKVQNCLGEFYFRLGQRYHRREQEERAATIFAAVLEIRRRVLPPGHPDILQSAHALGAALMVLNKLDDAEPLLKEALAGRRTAVGPGNLDTLQTETNYVQLLLRRKKAADAIAECQEALAAAAKQGNAEHPQTLVLLGLLAGSLAKERPAEALEPAERAAGLARKVYGEQSEEYLRARRDLGAVLMSLKRATDAEPHLRAVYEACLSAGPTDVRTFQAAARLGDCLLAQKRYADAESLLVGSFDALRGVRGAPKSAVQAVGGKVVRLYEAWGKPEKAAEWREKLK